MFMRGKSKEIARGMEYMRLMSYNYITINKYVTSNSASGVCNVDIKVTILIKEL